jgi:hypothetical protein
MIVPYTSCLAPSQLAFSLTKNTASEDSLLFLLCLLLFEWHLTSMTTHGIFELAQLKKNEYR